MLIVLLPAMSGKKRSKEREGLKVKHNLLLLLCCRKFMSFFFIVNKQIIQSIVDIETYFVNIYRKVGRDMLIYIKKNIRLFCSCQMYTFRRTRFHVTKESWATLTVHYIPDFDEKHSCSEHILSFSYLFFIFSFVICPTNYMASVHNLMRIRSLCDLVS